MVRPSGLSHFAYAGWWAARLGDKSLRQRVDLIDVFIGAQQFQIDSRRLLDRIIGTGVQQFRPQHGCGLARVAFFQESRRHNFHPRRSSRLLASLQVSLSSFGVVFQFQIVDVS